MMSACQLTICLLLGLWIKVPETKAQDLPPEGGSFFDSMQNTLGISYDGKALPREPHPFEALLKQLNQHSTFFTAVIPFGRSLQKMAAYPQSLKYPRVLLATSEISKSLNTHFRGRLFIAYVEAARKLEVISFNPILGRYEFQIVDNFYPGGKAQARYMPRSLCLRCHQGGTPIFASGEWLETTAFNPELLKLTQAAIGSREYFGIPLARDDPSSKYEAIAKPEHFEDMVRFGAILVGYQKAWQEICALRKQERACKRKLIKWMLLTNLFESISLEPDLELLRDFVAVLGDGRVHVPSEQLPDHNPIVRGELSFQMPAAIDPSLPREPMAIIMPSKDDPLGLQFYKFYIFVKSMGDSFFTAQDFSHLRTGLADKIEPVAQELSFRQHTYKAPVLGADKSCLPDPNGLLQGLNAAKETKVPMKMSCFQRAAWLRFVKAVDDLPLAPAAPLSRENILVGLDSKLGTQFASNLCCRTAITSGAQVAAGKRARFEKFKDQRLQSFARFCSECHLYQDLPPPFLAGETEAEVLENIRKRARLIEFRLQSRQMPPQFAGQQPTDKEREHLLEDLKRMTE